MGDSSRALLNFIDRSPSPWHACENIAQRLREAGFAELCEQDAWTLRPGGKYFLRRNGSSLLAFRLPEAALGGFLMSAAHSDSPAFQIKWRAESPSAGVYTRLCVEKYGGMLCASWLDRPLSAAGRVLVREGSRLIPRLLDLDRDLLLIPSLAIHMDRDVNDGKKYDVNVDMLPLIGSELCAGELPRLIAQQLGAAEEDLLAAELRLYPRAPGTVWGAKDEYISAARLDDLQCAYGCLEGFLRAAPAGDKALVYCLFDNEEVGSGTKQGADSDLLIDTLRRVCGALGRDLYRCLAGSFMVSADNAHAVHPNHPEYADEVERPKMNGGVVIKTNAGQKYSTDALSAAVFEELCRRADVPVQRYANRPDLPGGSTLGHISTAHVSVDTVDIGLAQLAMHSAFETAGAFDTAYLIRAMRAYYSCAFDRSAEGITL